MRLHVVSGKGGTGKTSVSAALALMLAQRGARVLVCEIEGRQGLAGVFGIAPLSYRERLIDRLPGGGELHGMAVDAESALLEYLDKVAHAAPVGALLRRFGAVDFVTTIAPGLRDVLLTGKVYEAVGRTVHGRRVFDAVVLDAPPTGRITKVLNVNAEVAGLAKMGPIHSQAQSIMRVFRDPNTAVHLTTLLEETPVQEALETYAELATLGLHPGTVIANRTLPSLDAERFRCATSDSVMADLVTGGLVRAGHEHTARSTGMVEALLREGALAADRVELQHAALQQLSNVTDAVVQLPELTGPVGASSLPTLVDSLTEQWNR